MHSTLLMSPHSVLSARRRLRGLASLALCMLLAACGFHLKGAAQLPFTTVYTNISENSEFGSNLRRAIVASSPGTRFVEDVAQAQVRLTQLSNIETLRELSLDAQGRVEEYELNLEFVFQITDAQGHVILPPTTLRSTRELPYDDSVVQAKQGEINTVFKRMQQLLIDRIVRHLASPDVREAFVQAQNLPPIDATDTPATTPPAAIPQPPTPWGSPRVGPGLY
ncbi:LPS-assembly lipoprotein LptE [Parapusillimonas sp. JC17]|uniref:LPS-assembly lipoprotein LptE n=1 Tax=Parapusillimonas sp. JC17 TaxID=3445768 RepID=UPI003F9F8723